MHSLMETVLGPTITQLAELKSGDDKPIEDQATQLKRCGEHYSKLYVQDLSEHPRMEAVLPSFGVFLKLDEEPTEGEFLKQ